MVRLIGKNKSVLKSAGSVSAGNKSENDLLALLEGLATAGSITGVWNMNELYNSVLNSDWIDDQTATTARAQSGGTMTLNSVSLGSYDYTYIGGDENITSFSNGNYFTSTADSRSALIYVDGDLTIASGQNFIPSNRKLFTAIYVKGNLDWTTWIWYCLGMCIIGIGFIFLFFFMPPEDRLEKEYREIIF